MSDLFLIVTWSPFSQKLLLIRLNQYKAAQFVFSDCNQHAQPIKVKIA